MKDILIKASGDVLNNEKFIKFVNEKAKQNKVVAICGGGTQISEALIKAGYKIKYDALGRIVRTQGEKRIVKKVLEKQKRTLNKIINSKNLNIVIPILKAGTVEAHINGDNLVKAYYLGFDMIYVFTLRNRVTRKKESFKNYPKVKVLGI